MIGKTHSRWRPNIITWSLTRISTRIGKGEQNNFSFSLWELPNVWNRLKVGSFWMEAEHFWLVLGEKAMQQSHRSAFTNVPLTTIVARELSGFASNWYYICAFTVCSTKPSSLFLWFLDRFQSDSGSTTPTNITIAPTFGLCFVRVDSAESRWNR